MARETSGESRFGKRLRIDPDQIRLMCVINAVVLKVWRVDLQPTTDELKQTVEEAMADLKTPGYLRGVLDEIISELYGPARQAILERTRRHYKVETHKRRGSVTEDTLLKWKKTKKWDLWIRKSDSGIEVMWGERKRNLKLSNQMKDTLFLLAKERGRAKGFALLAEVVSDKDKWARIHALKWRLDEALREAGARELAKRITTLGHERYGLDLSSLKYCVSELEDNVPLKA